MNDNQSHKQLVQDTTKSFWKTIPPIWHFMRSLIHRIAREDYGITSTQFHVLRRIKEENKKTVSELSDCMFVSRPGVSRAVEELVKAGLLEREGGSNDRRVIYLSLSKRGEEVITRIHEKNSISMRDWFSTLDDADLECLKAAFLVMEKLLKNRCLD